MMNAEEIKEAVALMETLGLRRLKQGDLELELAPRVLYKTGAKGTTTERITENRMEQSMFPNEDPILKGLTFEQIAGIDPIPDDHPAAKLRKTYA